MSRIKGGRDLCVKLGLNTPGEEVDRFPKSTTAVRIVCDGLRGDCTLVFMCKCKLHSYIQVMDVCSWVYVRESPHPKCNRRMSQFKEAS